MNIRTVLLSLRVLLSDRNPDDPIDRVVADQEKSDKALFLRTAKFWAQTFGNGKF